MEDTTLARIAKVRANPVEPYPARFQKGDRVRLQGEPLEYRVVCAWWHDLFGQPAYSLTDEMTGVIVKLEECVYGMDEGLAAFLNDIEEAERNG